MKTSILGISIGAGCVGMAVLSDGKLLKWSTNIRWKKSFVIPSSLQIEKYLKLYSCRVIALKIPLDCNTIQFSRFIGQIGAIADAYAVPIKHYCLEDLKEHFLPGGKSNKRRLMEKVSLSHPVLLPLLRKEIKNSKPRYQKIFEAVAVAEVSRVSFDS